MNLKYKDFYLYLIESNDATYNAAVDFHERRDDQLHDIINSFIKSAGKTRIIWKTVPASLITNVWLQFGKYNRIDINKLDKIADQILTIFNAKTPEEQLYAIDKALNIIHQRNDLASMFIEGGTKTLLKIASQGGYSPDHDQT